MSYDKGTFGNTKAAINLASILDKLNDKDAHRFTRLLQFYIDRLAAIKSLNKHQIYFLNLVKKDFSNRIKEYKILYSNDTYILKILSHINNVFITYTREILKKT